MYFIASIVSVQDLLDNNGHPLTEHTSDLKFILDKQKQPQFFEG